MAHFGKDLEDFNGSRCIHIRSAEQTDNFTVYVVTVTVGSYSWTVKHRYSEFFELHEKLTACYKLDKSLLPPKKLFGNQTESFIKKRQRELEIYLQTILLYLAQHVPSCLAYFLDFDNYEIHGITQAMAEDLYNRGENLLQSKEMYPVTSLQLYSLTERLKLPEPTCDSGDVKKDLGHILDFITRAKHLKVTGTKTPVGTSNITMSKLPFDLTLFKSLQFLEIYGCNFHLISGLETVKQTLVHLEVHQSTSSMQDMFLQDIPHWRAEDGSVLVGNWDLVTTLDLSHNSLALIHPSIQLTPHVETLNLSHNEIEIIQNLQWLSQLTHVDLSHNSIHHVDSLHTKLGNIKVFILAHNQLESLHGFAKLFSLQTLDVSHNKISVIEEVQHISQLPCLENVFMVGNSVTNTLDYRTKTLEMFGDRVAEVILDQEKPSQKELDTVAVLQALRKAKTTKAVKKVMSRKNMSAASLSDAYSHSPSGSLSDHLEGGGGQGTSPISGPLSHSVPTAIPWSMKQSMASNRSQSSLSQDSESSYNSAVDVDEKAPDTHPFHFVATAVESSVKSSNNNNNNNSNNTHELVPEAHPFDLSFENRQDMTSSSSRPSKRLSHSTPQSTVMIGARTRNDSRSSLDKSSSSLRKHSALGKETVVETTTKEPSSNSESSSRMGGLSDANVPQKRNWISTYNAADLPSVSDTSFVRWLHQQLLPSGDEFERMSPGSRSCCTILDVMWCYAEQLSHPTVFVPCCLVLTPSTIFLEKLVGLKSSFDGVPQLQPLFILSLKNLQQMVIGPCYCYFRLEEAFLGKSGTFSIFGLEPQSVRRIVNNIISLCRKMSLSNELDCVDLNMHSDLLRQIISHEEKMPGMASDRLVLMIPIRILESSSNNFLILSENQVYCVGLSCTHWPSPSFQTSPENQHSLEILHEFSILNKIVDMKVHPGTGEEDILYYQNTSHDAYKLDVEFHMYQLSIKVAVTSQDWILNASDPQQPDCHCVNYLFPSSAYRDLFLDRLSNLRAEHENRMCPNVREEPEGGNEQLPSNNCQMYCHQANNDNHASAFTSVPNSFTPISPDEDTLTAGSNSQDTMVICGKDFSEAEFVSVPVSPNHSESNESFRSVLTDSDIYKEVEEYQGPINSNVYSSSPREELSVSPMSNFSRASISPPLDSQRSKATTKSVENVVTAHQDIWHIEQTSAKADSLPSSFDWKRFYFKSPLNKADVVDPQQISVSGACAAPVVHNSSSQSRRNQGFEDKSFGNRLFLDLKNAISKSGGNEIGEKDNNDSKTEPLSKPARDVSVVESELDRFLKQCVKSYDLMHTLPTKLKPVCLMNGAELRKFFYSTIAQHSNQEGLQEELHFVLWGTVIPYTNPRQEITSLIMLSTYAIYLVSDTEVKVAQTSRPSWMSHSRNRSDSAIAWKTERNLPNSPNKKHVKSYAVLRYKELHQVNVGLFDQCMRLTGSNENSVFTIATRDCQVTERFIQKLKQVLSLSVSSPSPMLDRSHHDLEQDFYNVRSHSSKSTLEGLVYTHPSKVNFVYPGDETVQDMLYLIKERLSSTSASTQNTSSLSLYFYMQCYLLPSEDNISPSSSQARSVIITPLFFALAEEDVVTYPLPDFVRGLPENPCHEILECRPIDSLKSIQLYQVNPHWICLTFADEKLDIVVDVAMQHFGQPQVERERQKRGPEISFKLFVQSITERDKLVQVLEKLWKQQVSVVGRMLDVHKV